MKKAIAIVLALLMALTPLGAFAPGEVVAEAETTGLVYGTDIPEFTTLGSRLNTEPYDCGSSHFEIVYDMTGSEDPDSELDAYMVSLENAGFTLRQANTAGSSRSFTYFSGSEGAYDVVHCNYVGSSLYREFHIVYGPESYLGAASAGEVPAYDTVAEPSISIIGMSDTVACLVVQLADGSFVIIDGGYGYSAEERSYSGSYYTRTMTYKRDHLADIEALYDFLAAKAPSGAKPQITWMITHADPDHITLPYVFMEKYSSGVDVNTVVCNFPADSLLEQWNINTVSGGNSKVYAANFMRHFASADHFLYHTGQKLYLPGCEIEFLMTHEDLYPVVPTACNHTSGAWRMTVGGKTILILGDCETELNNRMAEIYGSYLASDIVQPAHHGSNGGTAALYDLLKDDVKVCLWCCGDFPFYYDQRHTGEYSGFSFNAILRNAAGVSHYTNSATHTIKLSTLTEELGGGRLVTTGAYDGYRGTDVTYLSDKYGDTSVMVHASGYDSAKPFWVDQSFKANSLFLWNSSKGVSNVTSSKYPTGRTDVTTFAEANRTIFAKDIVLGYSGKYFSKGLGGHATNDRVDTSQVVFDIRDISGSMLHAVAGITGEAINKTDETKKFDLTFRIYGSMADAYSAASSFTLLSEVSGIEGYNKSANTAYNTAEFNVDISGWNYIKLECVSDGEAPGGAYAWGDVCVYTPMNAKGVITRPENLAGKNVNASDIKYLSDLYADPATESFVVGSGTTVNSSRPFTVDESFSDIFIWSGTNQRWGISTSSWSGGRALDITNADGTVSSVTYFPRDLAIGYRGTKFEKGLGAVVSPSYMKPASVIFDISALNADRFYGVGGITGDGNKSTTALNAQEVTFSVYGSKTDTVESSFELLSYTKNIHAYLLAEFDVDISGYKYLKLETSTASNAPSNKQFIWADACVYSTKPHILAAGGITLHENMSLTLYAGLGTEDPDSVRMRFEMDGLTKEVQPVRKADGSFSFTFAGITPDRFADEITAELLGSADEVFDTKTLKMKDVCQAYLDTQTIEGHSAAQKAALDQLIVDLLNYGEKAQMYSGHNAGMVLVPEGKTPGSAQPSAADNVFALSNDSESRVRLKAATVVHSDSNYLRFKYVTSRSDCRVVITDGNGRDITRGDVRPAGENAYYCFSTGIMPTQFDEVYTVKAYVDGVEEPVSALTYSVNSYAFRMLSGTNDSSVISELVKGLYVYGLSAETYVASLAE